MTRGERIERAARRLLDAMDRQYGQPSFSMNVEDARAELAALVPRLRDDRDKSRERSEAA